MMSKQPLTRCSALLTALILLTGCTGNGDNNSSNSASVTPESNTSSAYSGKSDVSSALTSAESIPVSERQTSTVTSEKPSSAVSSKEPEQTEFRYNEDGIAVYNGTRDPWLWPFAADSIWNMPIGSDAKLEKAGFKISNSVSVDEEILVKVPEGSPTVDIYSPSAWNKRWPGDKKVGSMQVPEDFTFRDASGYDTPNACSAFLMPDGRTIKQLEPTCRLETGNAQIIGWPDNKDVDIYGDGIRGTHYGSGLSSIGGSIRLGELTSDEPIKHALKINVWGERYIYYDHVAKKGYTWPAFRDDGEQAYAGENPLIRMGSLLTIPQDITAKDLGIKTEVGKKMFYALQNYGCYIVDNSARNDFTWSAELGVKEEVEKKYGIKMNTSDFSAQYFKDCTSMIKNLYVVTNNTSKSVGGGGTPCKPLAPDFKK